MTTTTAASTATATAVEDNAEADPGKLSPKYWLLQYRCSKCYTNSTTVSIRDPRKRLMQPLQLPSLYWGVGLEIVKAQARPPAALKQVRLISTGEIKPRAHLSEDSVGVQGF